MLEFPHLTRIIESFLESKVTMIRDEMSAGFEESWRIRTVDAVEETQIPVVRIEWNVREESGLDVTGVDESIEVTEDRG